VELYCGTTRTVVLPTRPAPPQVELCGFVQRDKYFMYLN
jgi:hypothetical protein